MSVETADTRPYPLARGKCPVHPPAEYSEWREEDDGISLVELWNGQKAWVITRLEHAQSLMKDDRLSNDRMHDLYPSEGPAHAVKGPTRRAFRAMDGEPHSYYRRLLARDFSARNADKMRPRIREILSDLVDDMKQAGPGADFVYLFAMPMSIRVTAELLGIPYEDARAFGDLIDKMLGRVGDPKESEQAGADVSSYMLNLMDERAAEPQDDLISRIVTGPLAKGEITRDDALVTCIILLLGGYETTALTLATGLYELLQDPEQFAKVQKMDADQIKAVAEEFLRFTSVADTGFNRFAIADIEIGGKTIKAGDGIVFHTGSINRDPQAFEEPDTFDVTRSIDSHFALGWGPHQCVGQSLARAEIQEGLLVALREFPNLKLAASPEDIAYRNETIVVGVKTLPLSWDV